MTDGTAASISTRLAIGSRSHPGASSDMNTAIPMLMGIPSSIPMAAVTSVPSTKARKSYCGGTAFAFQIVWLTRNRGRR